MQADISNDDGAKDITCRPGKNSPIAIQSLPSDQEQTEGSFLAGCEITSHSIREILDQPRLQSAVRELFDVHGLLLFRDCHITPEEETMFLKLFDWDDRLPLDQVTGPYSTDGIGIVGGTALQWKIPSFGGAIQLQGSGVVEDHHGVSGTLVSRYETREWHVDGAHDVPLNTYPPVATSMYCIKTPQVGGETLFTSGRAAFDRLPPHMQKQALELDACYDRTFRSMEPDGCQAILTESGDVGSVFHRRPIVIKDQLGRPSLYVGPAFTQHLIERVTGKVWGAHESQDFLGRCLRLGLHQNLYEHRWKPLDFIVWSNRSILHSPTETYVYEGQDRLFHRIRMASKTPVEPFFRKVNHQLAVSKQRALYGRLWALQQLLSSGAIPYFMNVSTARLLSKYGQSGFSLASATRAGPVLTLLLWLAYLLVGLWPKNHGILLATHMANMIAHMVKIPFLWDFEIWDWLMELSIVVLGFEEGARLARWQLIVFYLATAFYKLTRSFLSPKVSCAPIFVLALVDMLLPISMKLPQMVVNMLSWSAPSLTILIEVTIPVLLAVEPYLGVLLGLLFHFLITVQPPPGNAGGFSISIAVRYALFCRLGKDYRHLYKWHVVVPFLAAALALGYSHGNDWAVPVHAVMIITLVPAALETRRLVRMPSEVCATKAERGRKWTIRILSALTLAYAFGMPILGGDMGAATMFSNLRVYSKSNHLLVPTGLLLNTTTVRVDWTTSQRINDIHPNDATTLLTPRLQAWLHSTGHTGRQFAPYLQRSLSITISSNGEGEEQFIPYLLPDLEVRRLLQESFDAGEKDFVLHYTKLPSLDKVLYSAIDQSCFVVPAMDASRRFPCDQNEAPMKVGLPFALQKSLLFFSFPVFVNTSKNLEDTVELGCVC